MGSVRIPRPLRSVVIVRYKNRIIEDRCIQSVVQKTAGEYNLWVIDNARLNQNLSIIWNRALRHLGGLVCFMNSDCLIIDNESEWLNDLCAPFETQAHVLATGPTTNAAGSEQSKSPPTEQCELIDRMLSGFCFVVDAKPALDLGGFCEAAPFYGQESDLLMRGREAGWKTLWRRDVFVWHEGASTAKMFLDVPAEHKRGRAWYEKRVASRAGKPPVV